MQRIRLLLALLVLTGAAACSSDALAPNTDAPSGGCVGPAPEEGMICFGEIWSWH